MQNPFSDGVCARAPEPPEQSASRRTLGRYFAIYALWHLAAVAALLLLFWGFAADHARCSPGGIAAKIAQDFALGNYREVLALSGFEPTPYTTGADAARLLSARTGACEVRPVQSGAGDRRRYALLCGGEQVAVLVMENTGRRSLFGNLRWRAVSAEGVLAPYRYAVVAPAGTALSVNGAPFVARGNPEPAPGFGPLPEGVAPPLVVRCAVPGIYQKPQVAVPPGGTLTETDDHTALITQAASPAQTALFEQTAVQAAKKYASFITEDAPFSELSALMLGDTPFFTQMRQFYNGWYITHDSNRFESIATAGLAVYGDTAFSCEVAFDYCIVKGAQSFRYPTAYTLFFVRQGERYLLSNLQVRAQPRP